MLTCRSERRRKRIRIITRMTCTSCVSACGFAQTKLREQWKALNSELRDSGRRSRDRRPDCKTTFLDVSNHLEEHAIEKFFEKVTERTRDIGRRSRDRRPTVKQRVLEVSSNKEKFWKKSMNGHATVVGGHATFSWLSNNVFVRFKRLGEILKKVTERSHDSGRSHATVWRLSKNVFLYVSSN